MKKGGKDQMAGKLKPVGLFTGRRGVAGFPARSGGVDRTLDVDVWGCVTSDMVGEMRCQEEE